MGTLNLVSLSKVHQINQGDRLFDAINNFLIILSAIAHASSVMVDGQTHKVPRPTMRLNARKIGCAFILPLRGPLELALENKLPDHIDIGVTAVADADTPISGPKLHSGGLNSVMTHVISPVFLTFYDRYIDWLKASYGDVKYWPPILNFARIIRNAAAHGKISISDPMAITAEWRGFSYGPADDGKNVIGTEIRMGEILGLMFETNEELDRISAPVI